MLRNAVATSGPPASTDAFFTTNPVEPMKVLPENMFVPMYSAFASTPRCG
jgi:hypothetical protein